jgi:Flp pilus assembly protein protease CpaA
MPLEKILVSLSLLVIVNLLCFFIYKTLQWKIVLLSLLFSVSFLFLYGKLPLHIFCLYGYFFSIMTLLSLEDFKEQSLREWQIVLFLGLTILVRFFLEIPLFLNLISLLLGFLFLFIPYLFTRGKGMGLGDVIVFSAVSLLLKPADVLIVGSAAAFGGFLFGIFGSIRRKRFEPIPFVPFIQAALFFYLPFQTKIRVFFSLSL